MEKKKYEMPQVEVREFDVEMPMASSVPQVSQEYFDRNLGSGANRDNVWDMW